MTVCSRQGVDFGALAQCAVLKSSLNLTCTQADLQPSGSEGVLRLGRAGLYFFFCLNVRLKRNKCEWFAAAVTRKKRGQGSIHGFKHGNTFCDTVPLCESKSRKQNENSIPCWNVILIKGLIIFSQTPEVDTESSVGPDMFFSFQNSITWMIC